MKKPSQTKELLFIVGLPGSGKTPLLESLRDAGWKLFDDYKAEALDNNSHFCASKRYCELIQDLEAGTRCVVADIDFCRTASRNQAENIVKAKIPDLQITWRYFENNVDQCRNNINQGGRAPEPRLVKLDEYASHYIIPEGIVVMPVWKN